MVASIENKVLHPKLGCFFVHVLLLLYSGENESKCSIVTMLSFFVGLYHHRFAVVIVNIGKLLQREGSFRGIEKCMHYTVYRKANDQNKSFK